MNRVDWLRRQFSGQGLNAQDWQLGYDDGLEGHRQHQVNVQNISAYRKGWIEGNAAILHATVANLPSLPPDTDGLFVAAMDRRLAMSGDRRAGIDRRTVAR